MTKSAEEAALREFRRQDIFNCVPTPLTDALRRYGFTLIPTPDNPEFERMVKDAARAIEGVDDRDHSSLIMYYRAVARAVLLAAMGEGTSGPTISELGTPK